ncbi:PEP-CTERM sorting domain-containing protein [Falsiroseomonas oryzae]|uniref:PEP-CTERM sorting domain-containing protein n=1 Tax=Falsiroseomonas oryzae TaxID=2766473 RepID=UPI0022EB55D8|nr:PEP-CTERM sorting domain-containing protein [Roseomonas sp. MO-31]
MVHRAFQAFAPWAALLVAASGVAPASAAPIFFTDLAAFQAALSAASGATQTESFETHPLSEDLTANPSTANGITVASNAGPSSDLRAVIPVGNGTVGVDVLTQRGGSTITFTFASPINAFGIDIFDLGTQNTPTTLRLIIASGSQDLFAGFTGTANNLQFGGVIDTATPFTTVTFTNSTLNDRVFLDDLRYGRTGLPTPAPEPGTLALLGTALAGLSIGARRLRRPRA